MSASATLADIFRAGQPTPYHAPRPAGIRVRLDANESPFPLDDDVARQLAEHLQQVGLHRYPDPSGAGLKRALATWSGLPPERLVLGNGSDELISLIASACARPRPGQAQARIAFPTPSFIMYRLAAQNLGLATVELPLAADFSLEAEGFARRLADQTPNVVFLAWPNNPTGTLWSRELIAAAIARHPEILFVVDEAYGEYSGQSMASLLARAPNLVILRTLSKIGLAALRIGYAAAAEPVRLQLEAQRAPYNVGSLAQHAATWLLEHHAGELRAQLRTIVGERERLRRELTALGVKVFDSAANLLLVRVEGAAAVWQTLCERGILVRNFDPGIPGALRVSVGSRTDNDALLEAWPR
jgi:histidinol-phosphate aminotransferase